MAVRDNDQVMAFYNEAIQDDHASIGQKPTNILICV